ADLSTVNYTAKGTTISQVDPGVFFYWVKVDVTSTGSKTYKIDQSITTGNFSTFFGVASGSAAFSPSCNKLNTQISSALVNGKWVTHVTFNATNSTGLGTYFIGIKYSTAAVKGKTAPSPTTVHYEFSTEGVNNSTDGLDLKKKI